MPIPYQNIGLVDNAVVPDLAKLRDKSVIITGGISGLGLAYVTAFLAAGAYVSNADIRPTADETINSSTRYQFLKCDVRVWAEQLAVFKAAKRNSPHDRVDIVVANAGIVDVEPVYAIDTTNPDEPAEPDLSILNINLLGVTYTCKLAMHYFFHQHHGYQRQQELQSADEAKLPQPTNCLILKSSLAAYIDMTGAPQYQAAKYGIRELMRSLRRADYLRVCIIAPWFVATPILSERAVSILTRRFQDLGLEWAVAEDAVKGVMRVVTDESINGRTLGIVPRMMAKEGYVDLGQDDCEDGTLLGRLQVGALGTDYRKGDGKV